MKKTFFTFVLAIAFITSIGQPSITNVSYPNTVDVFDMFEITFHLGHTYSNPYDPDTISVYAVFTGPDNRYDSVIGFYYEGYTFYQEGGYEHHSHQLGHDASGWKIRFTPDTVGTWQFSIHAKDISGETVSSSTSPNSYSFNCQTVNNANGFISKANARYLKRDVMKNGQKRSRPFFPIGPNIAWYSCLDYGTWTQPRGIDEYLRRIDSLAGNCNYMRIFLNRYQYLNFYGPEYAETPQSVYFDSIINQKDAAELDYIVNYAAQNNINLMMCLLTHGDFLH